MPNLTSVGLTAGIPVSGTGTVSTIDSMLGLAGAGTWTDKSGTITSGGTSQQAIAATATRKKIIVQNPANATESLFLDFGIAAAVGTAIELVPGAIFESGAGLVSQQSVNVLAATTSHVFVMKEIT